MKRLKYLSSLFLIALVTPLMDAAVKVGESAPDFTLKGANGEKHALSDFKGKYVVLEWLNHSCPFVKKHYSGGDMQKTQKAITGEGHVWLSIISSAPGKQGYMDPDAAKAASKEKGVAATAVLIDDSGKVGKQFGAKRTPEMFIIDPEGKVVYHGAIDSIKSANPKDVAKADNYILAAFNEIGAGKAVSKPTTRPYGCGVKY